MNQIAIDLIQQGRKAPAGPYHAPREYVNEGVLTHCGDILPEYTIHYSGSLEEVTCTACLEQVKLIRGRRRRGGER